MSDGGGGGAIERVSLVELYNGLMCKYTVYDTRPTEEFDRARIRGSKSVRSADTAETLRRTQDLGRKVVLVTPDGTLGDEEARVWAAAHGVTAVLDGGFAGWLGRYPFLCNGREFVFVRLQATPLGLPSEVVDGLVYLGGSLSADQRIVDMLGIRRVVSLLESDVCSHRASNVEFFRFPIVDTPAADIGAVFEKAYGVLDDSQRSGTKTLVHCLQGISRSATIVVAFLMRSRRWTAATALAFVRDARQQVRPNRGFAAWLTKLEHDLGLSPTPTLDIRDF
jgi:rhodanese-related sulfurtransferase